MPNAKEAQAPVTPTERSTDAELVEMLNAGRVEAFDVLFDRYHGWALRLALRFVRDEGQAADAVQDAFVYFLGKFPGFEMRARLTTFLYPVVKHNAIGHAKAARRKTPTLADDGGAVGVEPSGDGVPPAAGDASQDAALRSAIESLPEGQREVLLMRIVHDMGVSEVAEALGVPAGTVKSRLFHALRQLREHPALADPLPETSDSQDGRGDR